MAAPGAGLAGAGGRSIRFVSPNRSRPTRNTRSISIGSRPTSSSVRRDEAVAIPDDLDYDGLSGLSNELRDKLTAVRPATLGQAARIEGMTPAALALLLAGIKRQRGRKVA